MTDRQVVEAVRRGLSNPRLVAQKLGLKVQQKGGSYCLVLCPVHPEKNASCSLSVKNGTIAVRCWGCGFTGDVLTLIAAVHGLDTSAAFVEVLTIGAELAGMQEEAEALRGGRAAPVRERVALPEPEPERDYPPADEVAGLWDSSLPVTEDALACEVLVTRRIDPDAVARLDAARVLRPDTHESRIPNWAWFKGSQRVSRPWTKTGHRMLLPVYDSDGVFRSVRAWMLAQDPTLPKRVPPAGYRASGVVLASQDGVALLRGEASPSRVVIAEGEPDTLARMVVSPGEAVIGVLSGSWHAGFAARVPYGGEVVVLTHRDKTGELYAGAVIDSVRGRAHVSRWQTEGSAA